MLQQNIATNNDTVNLDAIAEDHTVEIIAEDSEDNDDDDEDEVDEDNYYSMVLNWGMRLLEGQSH